jgi:hypothetical protein
MLINDRLALVSVNAYGLGDGSSLPQFHVADTSDDDPHGRSLFTAFRAYFEDLWRDAAEWDFVEYL